MKIPLVSVLIATHRERYFEEAVASALTQTWGDVEVLILAEPSTAFIGVSTHLADRRVRIIQATKQRGPARNHSVGLREARGRYVGVLNDDDVWEPNLVEILASALEANPEAVVAFGNHHIIHENGGRDEAATLATTARWGREALAAGLHPDIGSLAVAGTIPIASGAIFDRSAGPRSVPRIVGGSWDRYVAGRLAVTRRPAVFVPEYVASWRQHENNLTVHRSVARSLEAPFCHAVAAATLPGAARRTALRALPRSLAVVGSRILRG